MPVFILTKYQRKAHLQLREKELITLRLESRPVYLGLVNYYSTGHHILSMLFSRLPGVMTKQFRYHSAVE